MSKYKPIIYAVVAISLVVGVIVIYNKVFVEPLKTIQEQNQTIQEQQEQIQELNQTIRQNRTIYVNGTAYVPQDSTNKNGVILFIVGLVIGGGILYFVLRNRDLIGEMRNREYIIRWGRKYAAEVDKTKVYKCIKYKDEFYKGDTEFAGALVLYSTHEQWRGKEYGRPPPRTYIKGYLVDRRKIDMKNHEKTDIWEDFEGLTIDEAITQSTKVAMGMRGQHYRPYQKPSYIKKIEQQLEAEQAELAKYEEMGRAFRGDI